MKNLLLFFVLFLLSCSTRFNVKSVTPQGICQGEALVTQWECNRDVCLTVKKSDGTIVYDNKTKAGKGGYVIIPNFYERDFPVKVGYRKKDDCNKSNKTEFKDEGVITLEKAKNEYGLRVIKNEPITYTLSDTQGEVVRVERFEGEIIRECVGELNNGYCYACRCILNERTEFRGLTWRLPEFSSRAYVQKIENNTDKVLRVKIVRFLGFRHRQEIIKLIDRNSSYIFQENEFFNPNFFTLEVEGALSSEVCTTTIDCTEEDCNKLSANSKTTFYVAQTENIQDIIFVQDKYLSQSYKEGRKVEKEIKKKIKKFKFPFNPYSLDKFSFSNVEDFIPTYPNRDYIIRDIAVKNIYNDEVNKKNLTLEDKRVIFDSLRTNIVGNYFDREFFSGASNLDTRAIASYLKNRIPSDGCRGSDMPKLNGDIKVTVFCNID